MKKTILANFHILTPLQDTFDFFKGTLFVENGKITEVIRHYEERHFDIDEHTVVVDGLFKKMIIPGLIQTHIHLCQSSHRHLAENMTLLQWLKNEIWPYESSIDRRKMGKTVLMTLKEIISSGTTAVLDMGTVEQQEVVFEIAEIVGFRYTGGKAMMDKAPQAPEKLQETTETSIKKSMTLIEKYHGSENGLIHYAFAPRFLLSCTEDLLQEVRKISDEKDIIIHTHGAEHPLEVAYIKEQTGYGNISYLHKIGALNSQTVMAHMIHLDSSERKIIRDLDINIVHCPSANLKLGSGIAPIPDYLNDNLTVGIGADGAPCNNALNILSEMKLASLLQKGVRNDPLIMTGEDTLRLATVNGAKILRQQDKIGQIEPHMDADLVLLDMDTPQTNNFEESPVAALIYGADPRNVFGTMVRGNFLYFDGDFADKIEELDQFFADESSF